MTPSTTDQLYFFSVAHITNDHGTTFTYGINLYTHTYYLSKTLGINDCRQLDTYPPLDPALLNELCFIITEIEITYQKRPSLEFINREIVRILGRIRNPLLSILNVTT